MSTLRTVLLGTLVILALGAVGTVEAAVTYDAVVEWTGPYFRVINAPELNQMVDDPVIDSNFITPFAVAAKEHATGQRDVVYVVDTGHNRVQAFEVNTRYTNDNSFTWQAAGVAAANDFDSDQIYLNEWAAGAATWVIPHSEIVAIDGVEWKYVASLTGFTAADKVYTIDYSDATNAPEILFPANSLTSTSTISLYYAITDNQGGVTDAQGIGDVDYGTSNGATPVLTKIDQASGGPTSWQMIRSICLIANEAAATSDDVFLLDAADNSTSQNEELFYYTITAAGAVSYVEAYDDVLTKPYDVAVANGGTEVAAAVTVSDDLGPFDQATAAVYDRNQVTGHTYTVTVAAGNVTITDATTGRILVNAVAFADLDDPFLGIPGLTLPLNAAVGASNSITTTAAVADRYLFVADTGSDRIKMIAAEDGTPTATDDWLPGDVHTAMAQPSGAGTVGTNADEDYRYTLANPMVQDYSVYTNAFPIEEGSLETVTMDPAGTPVVWNRVNDLTTAGPTEQVFEVDWTTGKITFGDGIHGALPTAGATMQLGTSSGGGSSTAYSTTPDIIRYGVNGAGPGRFSHPRGIAARWNSTHGYFDVYVADTGNGRIQKFAFHLPRPSINVPAYAEFLCEWSTASSSTDFLAGPVDVVVMLDNQTLGASQTCYVAVADQGNNRVVIYKDLGAMSADNTTVPIYDTSFGVMGNTLGQYVQTEGLSWLQNANNLDLYVVDSARGAVTKYTEAPTPNITLNFTGASALPQCFSPAGSYSFSFTTTNPPTGGTIDFYYDTSAIFDEATARLCIAEGTIPSSATSAVWSFANTPGGMPADNTSYYLFARMKNAAGSTVAYDQTTVSELFCMDSSLLPSLSGTDRLDNDYTLVLQNGLERSINLQLSYPDSCIMVGFGGTFDPSLVEITGITPGNGWDGTGYTNVIFNPGYSNTTGNFLVNTSITGSQVGLTSNGPHTMAVLTVKAKDNAIDLGSRSRSDNVILLKANSGMKNVNGLAPSDWRTQNIYLRFGYLGDIAETGSGADSLLPHLRAKPDGKINFDDQMVFTLGWNGTNNIQDPIADLGPTEGTVPNLRPNPDGEWNVDDILAFTVMYSWAAGAGFYRTVPGQTALNHVDGPCPAPLGGPIPGEAEAFTVSHLSQPKVGELMTVDLEVQDVRNLMGALLTLGYNPDHLELLSVEKGHFLEGSSGSMFFHRTGDGWVEISTSRLDRENPGVDGSGTLAQLTFRILNEAAGDLSLSYDLRSASNKVLSRGDRQLGPYTGVPAGFQLYSANPNPVTDETTIVFSLPTAAKVNLSVYDVSGRLVRTLANGQQESGYHVVSFNGRNEQGHPLPAGVYFYRLQGADTQTTQKIIITR